MYNDNEEIQVIGVDLGKNLVDWQTNYLLQTESGHRAFPFI